MCDLPSNHVCTHVKSIVSAEVKLLKEHLDRHKWYRHIEDDQMAMVDFVREFSQLMRDSYCGEFCAASGFCSARSTGTLPDISDGELTRLVGVYRGNGQDDGLSRAQVHVIKLHIATHKWIHRFSTYEEAVRDFLDKFGWIVDGMYEASKEGRQ